MPALLLPDSDIAEPIRCIISDVDGVLTDGRIIYDGNGVETKCFHVHDGLAIKLWMNSGFHFGILTSRNSSIVANRAKELGIDQVVQGKASKLESAKKMIADFGCEPSEVCYIGDDLPDLPVMKRVALAVSPSDATNDARDSANWVLSANGGRGVVRELIERLLKAKHRWGEHLPE